MWNVVLGCFMFYYIFIMAVIIPAYLVNRSEVIHYLTDRSHSNDFDKWEKRIMTKKRYSPVFLLVPIALPIIGGCLLGYILFDKMVRP